MKILQLLLRCGMICREELSVVLELMPDLPERRKLAVQESGDAAPGCGLIDSIGSRG
jgi:hypothetical protein